MPPAHTHGRVQVRCRVMMAEVVSQMGAGLRENCKHAVVPKEKSLNEEESEKVTREPDYRVLTP